MSDYLTTGERVVVVRGDAKGKSGRVTKALGFAGKKGPQVEVTLDGGVGFGAFSEWNLEREVSGE